MSNSANLNLPFLLPNQAQKHVTHNTALLQLDAVVQLVLVSTSRETPPSTPGAGDRYFLPENAQGVWREHAGEIAIWQDEIWHFIVPQTGWSAYDLSSGRAIFMTDEGTWSPLVQLNSGAAPEMVDQFGINASADTQNRLSIRSPASLFSHTGTDHRLVINKADGENTASVLFQTNHIGQAEVGLTGANDLQIRVSRDGDDFIDAIKVNNIDGRVLLGSGAIPGFDQDRFSVRNGPSAAYLRLGTTTSSLILLNEQTRKQWQFQHTFSDSAFRFVYFNGSRFTSPVIARETSLDLNVPLKLPVYDSTTLPSAPTGAIALLRDAASLVGIIFHDGTIWRRVSDGSGVQ